MCRLFPLTYTTTPFPLQVHASIHAHFNGAFYCNVDMAQFAKEHPEYDRTLLTFVLMSATSLYWPYNGYMSDYNECDTKCTRGQSEPCGCTCKIDVWSLTDDEVHCQLLQGLFSIFVWDLECKTK